MKILVTGCAGFIGFHTTMELLKHNHHVIGLDSLNRYYDPKLKKNRLKFIKSFVKEKKKKFKFIRCDISNNNNINKIFKKYKFKTIVHLAAQAGIRYSMIDPNAYFKSNLIGFSNLIELSKKFKVKQFIYASSSSVYGKSKKIPFSEYGSDTSKPLQIYAATKKSNEVMAHAYSHLFGLQTIGLRFFTVYGPWGRPDMALFKFTENIIKNKKINVFNFGKNIRDFTFVMDIVNAIIKCIKNKKRLSNYEILNIGNEKPIRVIKLINMLEKKLGKNAKIKFLKNHPSDMVKTFSKNSLARNKIYFNPQTKIDIGVKKFINWYKSYYKII